MSCQRLLIEEGSASPRAASEFKLRRVEKSKTSPNSEFRENAAEAAGILELLCGSNGEDVAVSRISCIHPKVMEEKRGEHLGELLSLDDIRMMYE